MDMAGEVYRSLFAEATKKSCCGCLKRAGFAFWTTQSGSKNQIMTSFLYQTTTRACKNGLKVGNLKGLSDFLDSPYARNMPIACPMASVLLNCATSFS
jgi:hypothetical protein